MAKLTRRGFLTTGFAATAAGSLSTRVEAAEAESDALEVSVEVDGEPKTFRVGPDTSALTALRAAGSTGVKEGCGHGACGACTIVKDGQTACACLLPAVALKGARVGTIHGVAKGGVLHPVQRAFLAEDALQCGFCTPGFVVEAAHWVDAWRAEHGDVEPGRDAVAAAMAGHLCRCGAYAAIYRAIQGAAAGRFDRAPSKGPRADGVPKVTGEARYTVDIALPGMLEGAVLRATTGAGRLVRLDLAAARAVPGVRAVVRLAEDGAAIRYFGQELAAVAADDEASAHAGIAALAAEIEPSAPIIGLDAAMAPGATEVFAKRAHKQAPSAAEGLLLPTRWKEGNVRGPFRSDFFSGHRKAEGRIEEAAIQHEATFDTQIQAHCTLEPHATVAKVDGERIEVWASTQSVTDFQADIADHFEVKEDDVTVHAEFVGGGFGAKAIVMADTIVAIELAREANLPVRVALSRADEIAVGGNRPAQRFHMRMGATESGHLAGFQSEAYADGGVSVGTITGFLMRLIYPSSRKELLDHDVVTNSAPAKPLRGPGGPPAFFALEQMVDEIAKQRGESPFQLRRRWDPNAGRIRIYDWMEGLDVWKKRPTGPQTGRYRVGVGVASAAWFYFTQVNTQVEVTLAGGRITASTASQDMGNGTRSAIAWALADALGLEPGEVEVSVGSTDAVQGPMSAGSRTTASVVPAAEHAAEQIRDALVDHAREARGLRGTAQRHGLQQDSGGFTSWKDLIQDAPRISVVGRRKSDDRAFFLPFALGGLKIGKQSPGAVQLTEVEVDTWTGKVRVTRAYAGIAVGRIVVPALARSQVEGGIVQGIGYALYEDRRLDPHTGVLLTAGLEDYRIPGIGDAPEITVHFDEQGFEDVRGGGVGLAEICTVPCAASVANAVANATGVRMHALPIRPDRVRGALA
ncbi:MAG: molybdopterin-dependent oxidoreductase [Alphaproteobacteria bacterium]|nr:molybdopterin-dependent oxidoreductase [Alphaproteobacteria bacterium]